MTVRRCLLLLTPLLLAADEPARPTATTVSLDGQPRTLAAAAAELSRQANIPIDTERAVGDRMVQMPLTNMPFWEAIDQLARKANQRLTVAGQGARVVFSNEPYRIVPTSISGPFRFAARSTFGRLDLDTGVSRHEVLIEVTWEPKFKAYFLELDPRTLTAHDERGQPLTLVNEGTSRMPVTETGPELSIKLRGVPRSTARIGKLEGAVKFLGTSQMLRFAFDLGTESPSQKRAEVTGTLSSFRKNVRLWTAVVDLQYPRDMPEFESFQSFLLDNEAWLLRADGTKFPIKKFELGFERQGKIPITYYIPENDKDGPMLSNLKDWQLVVRVPGRIVEERVPFRLQDVALP